MLEGKIKQQDKLKTSAIGKFDAHVNKSLANIDYEYIKITVGNETRLFQIKNNVGASNDTFIVLSKSFSLEGAIQCQAESDAYQATYEKISKSRWRIHKIYYDLEQWLAFIGLILGISGLIIDASFDIGKVKPWIQISSDETFVFFQYITWGIIMKCASWVLKIVGLFLLFWKGLISSK